MTIVTRGTSTGMRSREPFGLCGLRGRWWRCGRGRCGGGRVVIIRLGRGSSAVRINHGVRIDHGVRSPLEAITEAEGGQCFYDRTEDGYKPCVQRGGQTS